MPFSDILGQKRALNILKGILSTGRLATTYLFNGEKGVGKFTTAIEFARTLNCESPVLSDACGTCTPCLKIGSNNHPDILIVVPDNTMIRIEQVREIEGFIALKPYEGKKKVVIVDDADMMNTNAENAFLKTLEEPPEDSIIILVSSRSDVLSDTIRSRCLTIRFSPLSVSDLRAVAESIGRKDIDETLIRLAMGRAGTLLDTDILERRNNALSVFEDMFNNKELPVPKEKEEISELIDYSVIFIRDMVMFVSTASTDGMFNRDVSDRIVSLCKESSLKGIIKCYSLLNELKWGLFYNLNKSIVFNYLYSVLSTLRQKAGIRG